MDAIYEAGLLPVKSAGDSDHANRLDCTVSSPGAARSSFTVGGYDQFSGTNTLTGLRSADIWAGSARGGTTLEGNQRVIIGLAAPVSRINMFDINGGYDAGLADDGRGTGTSLAAPQVSALAIDSVQWDKTRPNAQDWLDHNPGLLHATLLLMGDRQSQFPLSKIMSGGDNLFGVGRLRAREFTGSGMDEPWAFNYGQTCVTNGHTVTAPISFTPIANINVIKIAAYWYWRWPNGPFTPPIANVGMRLVNGNTNQIIRSSTAPTDNFQFLIARQGNGGTDTIQNVPLQMKLDGNLINNTDPVCGANSVLVNYAHFFENSSRDEASPTAAAIPPE